MTHFSALPVVALTADMWGLFPFFVPARKCKTQTHEYTNSSGQLNTNINLFNVCLAFNLEKKGLICKLKLLKAEKNAEFCIKRGQNISKKVIYANSIATAGNKQRYYKIC